MHSFVEILARYQIDDKLIWRRQRSSKVIQTTHYLRLAF